VRAHCACLGYCLARCTVTISRCGMWRVCFGVWWISAQEDLRGVQGHSAQEGLGECGQPTKR
jgi:hypothetical protein